MGRLWRDPWNGNLLIRSAAANVARSRWGNVRRLVEAYEKLRRVHEDVFLANSRFWYEPDLREADGLICIAMSNLRAEFSKPVPVVEKEKVSA